MKDSWCENNLKIFGFHEHVYLQYSLLHLVNAKKYNEVINKEVRIFEQAKKLVDKTNYHRETWKVYFQQREMRSEKLVKLCDRFENIDVEKFGKAQKNLFKDNRMVERYHEAICFDNKVMKAVKKKQMKLYKKSQEKQ
jgi:hypothetical protein